MAGARYPQPSKITREVQGPFNPGWQLSNWLGNLYNEVFPEQHPMESLSNAMNGDWWSGQTLNSIQQNTPVCPTCGRPLY